MFFAVLLLPPYEQPIEYRGGASLLLVLSGAFSLFLSPLLKKIVANFPARSRGGGGGCKTFPQSQTDSARKALPHGLSLMINSHENRYTVGSKTGYNSDAVEPTA